MAVLGESELKMQIKSGSFSHAYMLYGEESYLKEFYAGKLRDKLVDSAFSDFNVHIHEGKNSGMDDILMDASMLPMMGEYTFVLAHDFPFDSNSDEDKLKEFLEDLPETTVLVFWYDSIGIDTKKNKKWERIVKLFAKYGSAVNLQKRSEAELVKLVTAGAGKRNCQISKYDAQYFISVVGSDIQTMLGELEKLCYYVNGGEITKKVIDEIAVKSLQARIYDLSRFILKGDSNGAYGVLNTLFAQKEEPLSILATLSGCYVDMYRVKCARQADVNPDDILNYFNYKGREFLIKNALRDGANISTDSIREALEVLADTDEKMKSTAINQNILLEETVAKLLVLRAK